MKPQQARTIIDLAALVNYPVYKSDTKRGIWRKQDTSAVWQLMQHLTKHLNEPLTAHEVIVLAYLRGRYLLQAPKFTPPKNKSVVY